MHSKFLPWDFIHKFPQTISTNSNGLLAYLTSDPYIEAILTKQLPKKEKMFHCYSGSDITRDFIEEHFCNLSFFSQNENIYIINAELIPAQNFVLFSEKISDLANQLVVLFFTKSTKLFLELSKRDDTQVVTIEAPRFWEGQKMLSLAMKVKQVDLKPEVIRFLLENLEHNFESFFRALDSIKVTFENGQIDFSILKELILRERFDFFEMVDLYYQNPNKLYKVMLSNELDFDWLRSLANFMQGHLAKILFPQEIREKNKLSKYDEAILFNNERLNLENVQNDLKYFSELEILAKSKDQLILNSLRLKILETNSNTPI